MSSPGVLCERAEFVRFVGDLVGVELADPETNKVAVRLDARRVHSRASLTCRPRLRTLDTVSLLVGIVSKQKKNEPY